MARLLIFLLIAVVAFTQLTLLPALIVTLVAGVVAGVI